MKDKNFGYTLVELMVSLSIFTIVIGALLSVLIYQNTFFGQASAKMDISLAARKSMNSMVKELRVSKNEVVDVYDRPINEAGAVLDNVNGRSIVFQVPVDWDADGDFFDDQGRIEWGAGGELDWSIEYYWDSANERIMRRVWSGGGISQSDVIIAENISAFRIQGLEYNSLSKAYELSSACSVVDIELTARMTTLSGRALAVPLTYTLSNRIRWRN